ncbi:MAG TPA: hypothetical protein VGO62_16495 [Myxococcota bacterium]|jgi:hypothetical protein
MADTPWTAAMVSRAVLAFEDIDRVPAYDDDAIRAHVRDFLRFVRRVEAGGVADAAVPLARSFVAHGYQWLADHPQYAPVATKRWSTEMVERLILWFNDAVSSREPAEMLHVAERIHTFERVVKSGAVDGGDAEALADAFLQYAYRWLHRQPQALAHFEGL